MVTPKEHDTVLVTGGNEIGLEGTLVCVDGEYCPVTDYSRYGVGMDSRFSHLFHLFLPQDPTPFKRRKRRVQNH
jgi:hypothetical protein